MIRTYVHSNVYNVYYAMAEMWVRVRVRVGLLLLYLPILLKQREELSTLSFDCYMCQESSYKLTVLRTNLSIRQELAETLGSNEVLIQTAKRKKLQLYGYVIKWNDLVTTILQVWVNGKRRRHGSHGCIFLPQDAIFGSNVDR